MSRLGDFASLSSCTIGPINKTCHIYCKTPPIQRKHIERHIHWENLCACIDMDVRQTASAYLPFYNCDCHLSKFASISSSTQRTKILKLHACFCRASLAAAADSLYVLSIRRTRTSDNNNANAYFNRVLYCVLVICDCSAQHCYPFHIGIAHRWRRQSVGRAWSTANPSDPSQWKVVQRGENISHSVCLLLCVLCEITVSFVYRCM